MLLQVGLVAEVLATFICLYCIYGRRPVSWSRAAAGILGVLLVLEFANYYGLGGMFPCIGYLILFVYCRREFGGSFRETTVGFLLCVVIVTCIQFVFFVLCSVFLGNSILRNVCGNVLLVVFCRLVLPVLRLHRLKEGMCRRSGILYGVMGFICLVTLLMVGQGRLFHEVEIKLFILVVPGIVLLLWVVARWYGAEREAEKAGEEIRRIEDCARVYDGLLVKVRLRQHELKNHMAALFSTHYTYKSYEKLVRAQKEYCGKLEEENRYNDLLLLEDGILVGFLYRRFLEMEGEGIVAGYRIKAGFSKSNVPVYYVIEMLGIMLDNAVEALEEVEEKEVFLEVSESEGEYEFVVRNRYPYVGYDRMADWFGLGYSGKGKERGLGLYHLKGLCEEWNCGIACGNLELEGRNWVLFRLKVGKADKV